MYSLLVCQPTNLWWEVPPVVRTSCDKQVRLLYNNYCGCTVFNLSFSLLQLPEISVLSNPYVVGDLEILVHGECMMHTLVS